MVELPSSLSDAALQVINTPDPAKKVERTHEFAKFWQQGKIVDVGRTEIPDRPPTPAHPQLLQPKDMPKRPRGSLEGRTAFVHAIAHIEFVAINLAWDLIGRFTYEDLPQAFFDDWVRVARDEAEHFSLLQNRLVRFGCHYGQMPAHDGLWESARDTADDILARLAIVPMVLEARGLDTTPRAISDLRASGDTDTATIMETIAHEEIPHLRAGVHWFEYICAQRSIEPVSAFHTIVHERFRGKLRPPFNHVARQQAGMQEAYYFVD